VRPGLLYAGTETGIFVSWNNGEWWQSLRLNLPVVPIHDLTIKDSDLIAATHGRSFWVLDDITPLRQVSAQIQQSAIHLFTPRSTIRFMTVGGFSQVPESGTYYRKTGVTTVCARREEKPTGEKFDRNLDAGQNPPDGVIVVYALKERSEDEVRLSFLDASGKEIKSFSSAEPVGETTEKGKEKKNHKNKEPRLSREAGAHRFVWNMRYSDPIKVQEGFMGGDNGLIGPLVAPGTYHACLTIGDQSRTVAFDIEKDPRIPATQQDLEDQLSLLLRVRDQLSETHEAITLLRDVRQHIEQWEQRVQRHEEHKNIASAGKALKDALTAIEEVLIQVKASTRQDTLNYPAKLNAKLAALTGIVASADAVPTKQAYELFEHLSAQVAFELSQLQKCLDTDLAAFNSLIREAKLPAVPSPAHFNTHGSDRA
jgi:hypothetical protein